MLVDTHCHLDFKDFDKDLDIVIDRARQIGVSRIINVGSSIEGTRRSIELAGKYEMIYASAGIHPHEARTVTEDVMRELKQLAGNKKVVAIGEVGLDYFRNLSPKDKQSDLFKKFIRISLDMGLPLIIHARGSCRETLDILKKEIGGNVNGVMHCFSENIDLLKESIDMGLHVSFTCNITFNNAKVLKDTAKAMPVERLLLETDAPFLAPQEFRGKRNEPANLTHLVKEWAGLLALSEKDIGRITTHNANRLFGLGIEEGARIAYEIRDSLYLNITNRCTNMCDFCIRAQTPFVKGHDLKLDREPSIEEILKAVGDPARYKEIVFCGYGEPTIRLDVIKSVAGQLKSKGSKIRVVTNGHGDLINSRPIAGELKGLVDRVSVSLNAETKDKYADICKPDFGVGTYEKILAFARDCIRNKIETEMTCLDFPGVDVKKCEEIAGALGATFRLRSFGVVG